MTDRGEGARMTGRALVHAGDAIVPADQPLIPVVDHGFLYGDSVYDVVRTANGRPFLLQEHLDRLRRSAALLYFELPWTDAEIVRRVDELLRALDEDECYLRIVATRGPGPISLLPDGCTPRLYVLGRRLVPYALRLYTEGCRVAIVPRRRMNRAALDPAAKTGNYLNNMLGLVEANRQGADDALFLNAAGHLTEATTANVWIVKAGAVRTPPIEEGLLAGITRDWVFRALPGAGVPVEEASMGREAVTSADEVFLSGTIKGIMPVTRVDGAAVGDGRPGALTRRLAALYEEALARN
jgi:branched-chain amino acid aminotransferase